jgi:hypothetical protein
MFVTGARLDFEYSGKVKPVFACLQNGELKIYKLKIESQADKESFVNYVKEKLFYENIKEYILVFEVSVKVNENNVFNELKKWIFSKTNFQNLENISNAVIIQYCGENQEVFYIARSVYGRHLLGKWETVNIQHEPQQNMQSRFKELLETTVVSL